MAVRISQCLAILYTVVGTEKLLSFHFLARRMASEASLKRLLLLRSLAAGMKPKTICLRNAQTAVPESTMIGLLYPRHTADLQQAWSLSDEPTK